MALKMHPRNAGIPLLIASSYVYLALRPDLRLAVPELVGSAALVTVLLAAACTEAEREDLRWSPSFILLLALLFRLLFLFRAPELSDDIFRYIWDGLRTLSGVNPYSAPPDRIVPESEALRHLASRVNHPHLTTIYPPAAQAVFAAGAALGGKALGMKGLLVALDLVSCAMILRLLAARGRSPAWGTLYAWHPLPVLEIAGSGHIDGAGVFFLVLALTLLLAPPRRLSRRPGPSALAAGASFSGAILTKLFPLVFLPAGLLLAGKRGRAPFFFGLVAAGGLLCIPFRPEILNALGTLETYARHWEFSGFAYQALSAWLRPGILPRVLLALAFLAFFLGAWGAARREGGEPEGVLRACYGVSVAFLLLTPTLHPWYALYLTCLLPLAGGPAGLALSWAVLLAYQVLTPYALLGRWEEAPFTSLLILLAPGGAALLCLLTRRRSAAATKG